MSRTRNENDRFEELLREVRVAGPSGELKARITGAAREAWSETSSDVPWQIVFRRLGFAAAAAYSGKVMIIKTIKAKRFIIIVSLSSPPAGQIIQILSCMATFFVTAGRSSFF